MPNEEELKKELLADTYPSNSMARRKPELEEKKDREAKEKVVCGTVKQQKKSFWKKATGVVLEDDTRSVGEYIVHDVLIPAFKAAISDMVSGGIDMLLFGQRRGKNITRSDGRSYVSYDSMSRKGRDRRPELSREARVQHDFDDLVFESRGDAETVLSSLADLVQDYDRASVADLLDLCGLRHDYTDNKWGWTDLRDAEVRRTRGGGYVIELPRTKQID